MAYSANVIANEFLKFAEDDGVGLTPMKLQKLVYFANGWYLALNGKPLINEQVEAWDYGPVIRTLYHEFKHHGNSHIEGYSTNFDDYERGFIKFNTPFLEQGGPSDQVEPTRAFLARIWEVYGQFSATQLSNMTHVADSPWSEVYNQYGGNPPKGTDIPPELMREYFIGKKKPVNNG